MLNNVQHNIAFVSSGNRTCIKRLCFFCRQRKSFPDSLEIFVHFKFGWKGNFANNNIDHIPQHFHIWRMKIYTHSHKTPYIPQLSCSGNIKQRKIPKILFGENVKLLIFSRRVKKSLETIQKWIDDNALRLLRTVRSRLCTQFLILNFTLLNQSS